MSNRWMKALGDAEQRYKKRRGIKSTFKSVVKTSTDTDSPQRKIVTEEHKSKKDPQLLATIQRILNQPEIKSRQPGELPVEAIAKMAAQVLDDLT